MKTTEIIGKKILDSSANEIGKIQDIDIDIKENKINKILINTNELSLKKVILEVAPDTVIEVGDYVLLNISKSELMDINKENDVVEDVEVVDPKELEERSKTE